MEQFDQQPKNQNVKEKSMYLLHLDGARILILSAITIGLLTVAFLVGMKITGESSKDVLASQDIVSDQSLSGTQQEPIDPSKNALPDLSAQTDINAIPAAPLSGQGQSTALPDLPVAKTNDSAKPQDLMAADENHVVIPPARGVSKTEKVAAKKNRKKADKKDSLKKRKDVVEVSSETPSKIDKRARGMYVLQVASFDRLDVAKKEVSSLKTMSYDAFVDKSSVKGKSFFRVRIGPVAVKDKAIQMMNELQSNDRYAECYIVKE